MTSFLAAILLILFSSPLAAKWDQETRASDLLSRIQVRVVQLALLANEAADGNLDAFNSLKLSRDDIDGMLHRLEHGDPRYGMSGYAEQDSFKKDLAAVDVAWVKLNAAVATVLEAKPQVVGTKETADEFVAMLAVLNSRMDEVVKILVEKDGSKGQVMIAARQILYADRMARRVQSIAHGGDEAEAAANGLQRDAQLYGVVLAGLIQGSTDLNIKPIANANAREILGDLNKRWATVAPLASKLLDAGPAVQAARHTADDIGIDSQTLLLKAELLSRHLHD